MSQKRITPYLKFVDSKICLSFRQSVAEKFYKRRLFVISWLLTFWVTMVVECALEYNTKSNSKHSRPARMIGYICFLTISVLASIIALACLRKPNIKATLILEHVFLIIIGLSALLTTMEISTYIDNNERFISLVTSIFFHSTYTLCTMRRPLQACYFTLYGAFFLGFFMNDIQGHENNLLLRVIFAFSAAAFIFWILNYSVSSADRHQYLEVYDSNQRDQTWKRTLDSLPQGIAIIDSTLQVKYGNAAFIDMLEGCEHERRRDILDKAFKGACASDRVIERQQSQTTQRNFVVYPVTHLQVQLFCLLLLKPI